MYKRQEAPNAPLLYRIAYALKETPLISIVMCSAGSEATRRRCIDSIYQNSTYQNFELLLVGTDAGENGNHPNLRLLPWEHPFHRAKMLNFAAGQAKGKYLLFLDDDTKVISPKWIEEMLMYAQRDDVGAVGAKLYFPNNTIEHAGLLIGVRGSVGRVHYRAARGDAGYMGRLMYAQNFSAVSGACMMISKEKFEQTGGFCEDYSLAFYDADLCLHLREQGRLVVFTPYAELYHYVPRAKGKAATDSSAQFQKDEARFQTKWKAFIEKGDPYYNPNFSLERDDFTL